MSAAEWKLRRQPFALRLAVVCLVLCLAMGELASLWHLVKFHEKKDDVPGLSMTDLIGVYHGVDQPSLLKRSLESEHGRQFAPDEKERAALVKWLAGTKVNADYDNESLGELAPAEILARRCVTCHARTPKDAAGAKGIGGRVPLEFWDDVAKVAFEKRLDPVPIDLLAMSTHAHALTLPLVAFVVGLLALATSWPARLVRALAAARALGLLVDLASWWLARASAAFVCAVVGGGALFACALALQMILIVLDALRSRLPERGSATDS